MTNESSLPANVGSNDGLGVMDADGIRNAIKARLIASNGMCGDVYLAHVDGVIRGLLWALTGTDHGTELTRDVANVLSLAGIGFKVLDDGTLLPMTPNV